MLCSAPGCRPRAPVSLRSGGVVDCCPYYLVSVGDTLDSIAKMYHIPGGAAWITAYNPELQART